MVTTALLMQNQEVLVFWEYYYGELGDMVSVCSGDKGEETKVVDKENSLSKESCQ